MPNLFPARRVALVSKLLAKKCIKDTSLIHLFKTIDSVLYLKSTCAKVSAILDSLTLTRSAAECPPRYTAVHVDKLCVTAYCLSPECSNTHVPLHTLENRSCVLPYITELGNFHY